MVQLHGLRTAKFYLTRFFHNHDFDFWAKWRFYATSRKKDANDGAGCTIKCLVELQSANLQGPFSNQSLTPEHLLDFAQWEI